MRKAIKGSSILALALLVVMLQYESTRSYAPVTYRVGEDLGWDPSISYESWPKGKDLHAGDILEFVYDPSADYVNVAVVNKTGYEKCFATDETKEYATGDDKIPLVFGFNYFITSRTPDFCALGMRMAINATAPPPSSK